MAKILMYIFLAFSLGCGFKWYFTNDPTWEPPSFILGTLATLFSSFINQNNANKDTAMNIGGESNSIHDTSKKNTRTNYSSINLFGKNNKIIKK